jgi:hypothetical protein
MQTYVFHIAALAGGQDGVNADAGVLGVKERRAHQTLEAEPRWSDAECASAAGACA